MKYLSRLAIAGLLCTLGATAPAAAQAVKGSKGPIMSKDELRACLAKKDATEKARADVEARNIDLARDRDATRLSAESLKAESEQIAQRNAAVRALNERLKQNQARVVSWNERAAKLKDLSARERDRLQQELEAEKAEIQKEVDALKAEQQQFPPDFEAKVAAYNARAQEHAKAVQAFNERVAQVQEASKSEQRLRDEWIDTCDGRRYREDDEIAIKRGK